jgi:hypothetical protein
MDYCQKGFMVVEIFENDRIKELSCPDGNGWILDPDDKGGRSLLRIHPDGNVPGDITIRSSIRFLMD